MKWISVVILNDYYICIISTFGLLSLQLFTIINKGSLSNISFVSLCGFRGGLVCLFENITIVYNTIRTEGAESLRQ